MKSFGRITTRRRAVAGYTAIPAGAAAVTVDSTLTAGPPLGVSGWWANAQRFLFGAVPALTQFVPWKAGPNPLGGPTTLVAGNGVDQGIEGGAIGTANGVAVPLSPYTVWESPGAPKEFGVVMRAKYPAVTAALQQLGISSASHGVAISLASGTDATHWVMRVVGVATTPVVLSVADTLWHDFALTFDKTTIIAWIDGVNVGQTTVLTNLSTDAMWPQLFNTTTALACSQAGWAYVAP